MKRIVLFIFVLLGACADRIAAPIVPYAAEIGTPQTIFLATNRVESPPGIFGIERSQELQVMQLVVAIPPDREIGTISDGQEKPNPEKDFALANRRVFDSPSEFQALLRNEIRRSGDREIVVFVHGYNNSFADSAFRMAQLAHDLNIDIPAVSFSWPSRGNPFGYQYDTDSSFLSRNSLADLLINISGAGTDRIILVAHSMGGQLAMETLRTVELSKPGWAASHIAGVMLIQPDINIDLFREQTASFQHWPQPFVVFASKNDRVLRLSGGLRGDNKQLGKLEDFSELSDLPISFVDVSSFSDGTEHFIAGTSESFINLLNSSSRMGEAFLNGEDVASASILGTSRMIGNSVRVILKPGER